MTRNPDRKAVIRARMAAHPGMTYTAAAREVGARDIAAVLGRLRQDPLVRLAVALNTAGCTDHAKQLADQLRPHLIWGCDQVGDIVDQR